MAIDRGAKAKEARTPAELIDDVESKVERVRVLYNQYFQGIEKLEPSLPRAEVDRLLRDLRKLNLRSGLRFRFQNLLSRFSILSEQWSRTVRQIEEGRYRPHLFRLQLHELGRVGPASSRKSVATALSAFTPGVGRRGAFATGEDSAGRGSAGALSGALSLLNGGAVTPAEGARGAGAEQTSAAPRQRAVAGPDEGRMRQIFDDYVAARRQTGEAKAEISFDAVRNAVAKQIPAVAEKHPCDRVDFKVVIRAGKAILKAVPVVEKIPEK